MKHNKSHDDAKSTGPLVIRTTPTLGGVRVSQHRPEIPNAPAPPHARRRRRHFCGFDESIVMKLNQRQLSSGEDSNQTVIGVGRQKKRNQDAGLTDNKTRTEQAKTRTEQAETRTDQAKSRTELAETRTEQAETRTELAKTRTEQAETRTEQAETRTEQAETRTEQAETRTEQAETRTEQAETALQRVVDKEAHLSQELTTPPLKELPLNEIVKQKSPLEQLTIRQREILQLIAESQNTKQIAEILKVSPKTVEYHRGKLMDGLNVHDIPGLVRFALRVGLIPPEI